MRAVDIALVLLSFGKSLSTVTHRAIQRYFDGHFGHSSSAEAFRSVRVHRRGGPIVLGTAVDVGHRQGPRGTAQLLGTGLGDAGRVAKEQRLLLLRGLLRGHLLKLDGHIVDSRVVEDFSNFHVGILIPAVLLILDVQGGDDLPADELPDVQLVNAANSRHGREFAH